MLILNKMDQDMTLFIAKFVLFAFIVTSPFYNVSKTFSFLNNIWGKIVLLVIVVSLAFIDLQLAIIVSIAFFILILNFNYSSAFTTPTASLPKQAAPAYSLAPANSPTVPFEHTVTRFPDTATVVPTFQAENVPLVAPTAVGPIPVPQIPEKQPEPKNNIVMQNMYEFPSAECQAPIEAYNAYMNESIMDYYIDDKVKPYEKYISQLTNEQLLENVSNGAFLQ